jgi:hypothetical protein
MPSLKASSGVNLKGWEPAQPTTGGRVEMGNAPPQDDPLARSPFMHASMPLMASTGDAFQRQFYSPSNLPQQRILPAKRGGGA